MSLALASLLLLARLQQPPEPARPPLVHTLGWWEQEWEKDGDTRVSIDERLSREVLLVRAESHDLTRELRDAVAKALGATWTEANGAWSLHRTKAQELAIFNDFVRRRTTAIERSRKARRELTGGMTPAALAQATVDAYKNYVANMWKPQFVAPGELELGGLLSPTAWLSVELESALPPSVISSLPLFQTTTFSTSPTSLQEPLPESTRAAVGAFESAETFLAGFSSDLQSVATEQQIWFDNTVAAARKGAKVGKVLLNVAPRDDMVLYECIVFDASGGLKSSVNWTQRLAASDLFVPSELASPLPATDDPVQWSATAKDFLSVFDSDPGEYYRWRASQTDAEARSRVLSQILKPIETDPLAFGPADVVCSSAPVSKAIVACLPDSWLPALSQLAGARLGLQVSCAAAFQAMQSTEPVLVEEAPNGTWIVRPVDQYLCQVHRASRRAATDLVRASKSARRMTLRSLAQFYFRSGTYMAANDVDNLWEYALVSDGVRPLTGNPPYTYLFLLLGSLDDNAYEAAHSSAGTLVQTSLDPSKRLLQSLLAQYWSAGEFSPGQNSLIEKSDLNKQGSEILSKLPLRQVNLKISSADETVFTSAPGDASALATIIAGRVLTAEGLNRTLRIAFEEGRLHSLSEITASPVLMGARPRETISIDTGVGLVWKQARIQGNVTSADSRTTLAAVPSDVRDVVLKGLGAPH